MSPKSMVPLLAALAALLVLPAPALAAKKTNVAVGIGDQASSMFDNQAFLDLKIKKARYFISWNAIDNPDKLARADEWIAGAKRRRVRALFHLDGVFTDRAPSVREYKQKVRALVKRYPSVREWGTWNEANSKTQPVFRNPKRTAKYFLALRSVCRRCTIVALDLLDTGNSRLQLRVMKRFVARFYKAIPRKKRRFAKIVGIHNYGDTNRRRRPLVTGVLIKAVRRFNRRAQFWMTETGGLAYFATETRVAFRCNEKRQARAVGKMFRLARKYRRYVKRLYPYNFYATDCDTGLRFDAGLIRRDGTKRPAYRKLKRAMRHFRR